MFPNPNRLIALLVVVVVVVAAGMGVATHVMKSKAPAFGGPVTLLARSRRLGRTASLGGYMGFARIDLGKAADWFTAILHVDPKDLTWNAGNEAQWRKKVIEINRNGKK